MITGIQIRSARGALNWSIKKLSEATSIPTATLVRYEAVNDLPKSRKNHLETLRAFFESQGIEFVGTPEDRPGIRISSPKPE